MRIATKYTWCNLKTTLIVSHPSIIRQNKSPSPSMVLRGADTEKGHQRRGSPKHSNHAAAMCLRLLFSRQCYRTLLVVIPAFSCMQYFIFNPFATRVAQQQDVRSSFISHTMTYPKPRRKIVLLGPHDRYNFGDLIFTSVVAKLLVSRAGFSPDDLLFGGMVTVDMEKYGGYNILSMKQIQSLSQEDTDQGPYDIIYLGGEAVGCNFDCGVKMLPDERTKTEARRERIHDCPYLVPKNLLLPPSMPQDEFQMKNYAVINSMGGTPCNECKKAIETADYIALRDKNPLFPDSAVMMKELYPNKISEAAEEVLQDLFPGGVNTRQKIIAVQHRDIPTEEARLELALALDKVSKAGHATIVFFVAGTAPNHDSLSCYKQIAQMMTEPSIVYEEENMWKSVGLISQAEAVLSTSLHVRIIAFLYLRPRLTWCGLEPKHPQFIALWDTDESPRCLKSKNETWSVLQRYYGPNPNITQAATAIAYEKTVKKYLESFDSWSSLVGWRRYSTRS
eukprot:scaffold6278_cov135-Skeletonema_dohrnii-CCMP3373.AAC.4